MHVIWSVVSFRKCVGFHNQQLQFVPVITNLILTCSIDSFPLDGFMIYFNNTFLIHIHIHIFLDQSSGREPFNERGEPTANYSYK